VYVRGVLFVGVVAAMCLFDTAATAAADEKRRNQKRVDWDQEFKGMELHGHRKTGAQRELHMHQSDTCNTSMRKHAGRGLQQSRKHVRTEAPRARGPYRRYTTAQLQRALVAVMQQ